MSHDHHASLRRVVRLLLLANGLPTENVVDIVRGACAAQDTPSPERLADWMVGGEESPEEARP